MVTAYFDATYNHLNANKPQPLMHTVAAYVGSRDNWRKFRKEWKLELAKKGLDYFHMTDFEFAISQSIAGREIPKKNLFYGWEKDDFVPFQKRLHRTITRKSNGIYRLESNASSHIKTDFDELLPDELKNDSKCSSSYIFNVWVVMRGILNWANRVKYNDPIHYIFAGGDGEGNNLERYFNDLFESDIDRKYFHLSKGYSRIGYGTEWMKCEPALQAADISAFECHKIALKWFELGCPQTSDGLMRKSMTSLGKSEHFGWIYNRQKMAENFADIIRYQNERKERGLK